MTDYKKEKDEVLAVLAKDGDADAMETLINRYKNTVNAVARSYFLTNGDTDDLVQEGMIGVFRAIQTFDSNFVFKVYAYKCIKSAVFSAIKKANAQKNLPLKNYTSLSGLVDGDIDKNEIMDDGKFDPEETFINIESENELKVSINKSLSDYENEILSLYLKGYSYVDIGEKIGKASKSIDNALQRIRKKILIITENKK